MQPGGDWCNVCLCRLSQAGGGGQTSSWSLVAGGSAGGARASKQAGRGSGGGDAWTGKEEKQKEKEKEAVEGGLGGGGGEGSSGGGAGGVGQSVARGGAVPPAASQMGSQRERHVGFGSLLVGHKPKVKRAKSTGWSLFACYVVNGE